MLDQGPIFELMEAPDENASRGDRHGESDRTLWWIAGCVVVVIAAPLVVTSRPAQVGAIAAWGSAIASLAGLVSAVAHLLMTKGKAFGDPDAIDLTSPYLRLGIRLNLAIGAGLVVSAATGIGFSVYWYPRPDPHLAGTALEGTPEEYALAPMFLCFFLLAGGVYWQTVQLHWAWMVRRARRRSESPTGTI